MAPTPETLTRHELIGLPIRVADAPNPDLVGIAGRVVSETMRTLVVATASGERQVPKRGTTLEFALPAEDVDCDRAEDHNTDEAAGNPEGHGPAGDSSPGRSRKAPGSASELGSETAGVRPRQSGPLASAAAAASIFDAGSEDRRTPANDADATSLVGRGECEGVVYVTVDGTRLLSRPAERTERAGDSKWR